jgi:predicted O-methyltransferase YrrM
MMTRIFCLLLAIFSLNADMPEPYRSINDLPFDGHGWFGNDKQLLPLIETYQPMTVIEIGSWLGCSTRFIAENIPQGGKIYAVDTWAGSPEEEVHMKDPRLPHLYQLFLSNIRQAGFTDIIIPVRMKSLEAAKALNVQADLIYLDAAHDTASVYNDIFAWYPHLAPGGLMCGDDWLWKSVRKAVEKAAKELNQKIYSEGNFWRFDPIPN